AAAVLSEEQIAGQRAEFEAEYEALLVNEDGLAPGERLHALFDLAHRQQMFESPEWATMIGWPDADRGRWGDYSLAADERWKATTRRRLAVLESIDRGALTEADRLSYDLYRWGIELSLEGERFPGEYLVINQMSGPQQWLPQFLTQVPARTTAEYDDLVTWMRGVPEQLPHVIERLEKGLESGVTPPRVTLRDVADQIAAQAPESPEASPLWRRFEELPESIPEGERERLQTAAREAIAEAVIPAFRELHRFWVEEYYPKARESIAMSALPEGEAWYAHSVKSYTTTGLTPGEIHDIGLREVARIRGEMDAVIEQAGFEGSFEEFLAFLRTDERFYFDTPEELLAAYRDISKRIDPELVKLFGRLPRLPYGVQAVPEYSERSQTTAYYQPGNLEAGRPGYFFANTYDLKSRPSWEMEALTVHEAVPGHHLQISLAQELEDVPEFRKHMGTTAFVEGWGLYSESLGPELGLYKDPYSKFGQLTYEMWRAIRLVVDTGIHSMGWSRERAIDYFKANAGKAEHDIVVEVDRYIVWPGQALAYKIGELKIQELRARAESELGEAFDVRAFHDTVLGNGAVPLDVLELEVVGWLEEAKAGRGKETSRPAEGSR
ncbi:MAG TPA: DUF885 domain-containing protein, partial [Thermoanaerobaculia bacterium]|nr:DUF885 domain-containing protein [Thermoanaerobaculia bacterium]